jgi:hypothetical protein
MNGFCPLAFALINIAKKWVNAGFVFNILAIEFSKYSNNYWLTCSVKPFSYPSKLTMMLFYLYKNVKDCFRNHYPRLSISLSFALWGSIFCETPSLLFSYFGSSSYLLTGCAILVFRVFYFYFSFSFFFYLSFDGCLDYLLFFSLQFKLSYDYFSRSNKLA